MDDKEEEMLRRLRKVASGIAVECRRVIQGCLREEEWRECDREYEAIILSRLVALLRVRIAPSRKSVRMSKIRRRTAPK